MKKIISVLVAVVLVFSLCAMPISAATDKSEWKKMSGPGKIELNEQGVKCVFDVGLTFFKYTKQMINVKNFTCTFIPHFNKSSSAYFGITLNASKNYAGTGSQGLFLLIRVYQQGTVNVEGQILHQDPSSANLTDPKSTNIQVDTTKPLVIKGVDNGNGTYTVSFEGGTGEYTFEIPENFQFTEDANGEGYFSFGGTMNVGEEDDQRGMTVVSINGIDLSGNKPEPESSSKQTTSNPTSSGSDTATDDGSSIIGGDSDIIGADKTTTDTDSNETEEASNSTLIIVIIVCGVIVLGVVAAVVIILIKKKSAAKETAEETVEKTEE